MCQMLQVRYREEKRLDDTTQLMDEALKVVPLKKFLSNLNNV